MKKSVYMHMGTGHLCVVTFAKKRVIFDHDWIEEVFIGSDQKGVVNSILKDYYKFIGEF